MAFKPAVVILDACVLYPFHLRNIAVQFGVDRLLDVRWTDVIHDEWMRSLRADLPQISIERLTTTRRLMNEALPQAMIEGYQTSISTLTLPDPDDRHVLAAAIAADASVILTWNLRDFPLRELKGRGLRAQTPDAVFADLYDQARDLTLASLANARRNLRKSRVSVSDFLQILRNQKLVQLSDRIANHPTKL